VRRVIPIVRIETDFDVIFASSVALKDFSNPMAEVALHFENEAADPLIFVFCVVRNWISRGDSRREERISFVRRCRTFRSTQQRQRH
jgi:hypothetical protein